MWIWWLYEFMIRSDLYLCGTPQSKKPRPCWFINIWFLGKNWMRSFWPETSKKVKIFLLLNFESPQTHRGSDLGPGPEKEGLYYSPRKYCPNILNIYSCAHRGLIRWKMAHIITGRSPSPMDDKILNTWSGPRVVVSLGSATRSLGPVPCFEAQSRAVPQIWLDDESCLIRHKTGKWKCLIRYMTL